MCDENVKFSTLVTRVLKINLVFCSMPQYVACSMRVRSLGSVPPILYKVFCHIKVWPDYFPISCVSYVVCFSYNWLKNQYGIDILNKRVSLFGA